MTKKVALVTGASSGIGREFALQLAAQGYTIIAVARRREQLQILLDEMPGDDHRFELADLADPEQVACIADLLEQQPVDLLVNNAGYSVLEPFYQAERAAQEKILAVNCGAVTTLAHAFLASSKAGDALVNVASIVSYLPTPAQPVYSATKAYISAFSECLWHEHRNRDVYVMGLCPGLTQTEFISSATGGDNDDDNLPAMMIQTATEVVDEAMLALSKRKKSIIVTGRANRMMLWMNRLLSRHRLVKVLGFIGDPERVL